jgi:hypothetical protein
MRAESSERASEYFAPWRPKGDGVDALPEAAPPAASAAASAAAAAAAVTLARTRIARGRLSRVGSVGGPSVAADMAASQMESRTDTYG